jgi:hypothetical protein
MGVIRKMQFGFSIDLSVVRRPTAQALWRAKKSHFQASVENGLKIVDKKTRSQQKQ